MNTLCWRTLSPSERDAGSEVTNGTLVLIIFLLSIQLTFAQANFPCQSFLQGDSLTIKNTTTTVVYHWNQGNVQFKSARTVEGFFIHTAKPVTDFSLPGMTGQPTSATFHTQVVQDQNSTPNHLRVTVKYSIDSLQIERVWLVYPEAAIITTYHRFRGTAKNSWATAAATDRSMIENVNTSTKKSLPQMGFLPMPGVQWKIRAVKFYEATDHHNTLVQEQEFLKYRTPIEMQGNIVWARSEQAGWMIVKESPLGDSQHAYANLDFVSDTDGVRIINAGVLPDDITNADWVRGYGFAFGITSTNETQALTTLRTYQKLRSDYRSQRDDMIVMNTWGDRGRDSRISESFALAELERAKRLGITCLQLDDGWQAGLSRNSASKQGMAWDDWKQEDWQPHPQRFPNGLQPVIAKAKSIDMEIGLWFNPSKKNSYAHWERDAGILIDLYKTYGIRIFKIDGIELADKKTEMNLSQFFETVKQATNGQVVFNFDVTAGKRFGYHYFTEYGNIFLENRYTDWGNYYTHWTLRNLWMLSKYVPPEKLQIEFLNKWRNENKYPKNDRYAPSNYSFDYLIAATLFAQPLAWLEASNLPEQAFASAALLNVYQQHREKIHTGIILPIGNEPDGVSWTGFQSIGKSDGYLVLFSGVNVSTRAAMRTYLPAHCRVRLSPLAGTGEVQRIRTDKQGMVCITMPPSGHFALYHYQIVHGW